MKYRNVSLIKCPKCGCSYLPAEIFVPTAFFGKPKNIVKGENGEILSYFGNSMDTHEKYICDKCGATLNITANVDFICEYDSKSDFNEDYVSEGTSQITMKEE